jgi:hypothetical protein
MFFFFCFFTRNKWFSSLSMMADLVHFARCVVDNDKTTFIVLLLTIGLQAKRRVVVRRVVAMLLALYIYKSQHSIWPERQCDIVTTRCTSTRRLACIVSDKTTRRRSGNALLTLCPAIASDKTHKSVPNYPPYFSVNHNSKNTQNGNGILVCPVWRIVGLSSCRPVANDVRQTVRCRAACCRDVTLSVGSNQRICYSPHDNAPFCVLR